MFETFTAKEIATKETTIHTVYGGSGEPLLLLHGYPQTHVCWHLVAPALAEHFSVVCTDLRGCGDSGKPPNDEQHRNYSKRVMAQDGIEVMAALGFDGFAVVGHDRGARVAHRMALGHAGKIKSLVLLDIVPTSWAFANVDKWVATAAFNWFFSAQEGGLPERLITAEADFYLRWLLDDFAGKKGVLAPEAVDEYRRCFTEETIRATCEEFRAAASIDLQHDEEDKARKVVCPAMVLWSATGMWAKYDVLNIWRERVTKLTGIAMNGGHFLAEEKAAETVAHLLRFLL